MIKRFSAILLSVLMAGTVLASCGDSDSSAEGSAAESTSADSQVEETNDSSAAEGEQEIPEPSLTNDGEKVDISNDPVILTVDGNDIDFDLFRYYYFYIAEIYNSYYRITTDQLESDAEQFAAFKTSVTKQFKNDYVAKALADQNGIELTDDEKAEIDQALVDFKAKYDSEEEAEKDMAAHYLTDEVYLSMMTMSKLYEKVDAELFGENGKFATSKEDFIKIATDKDKYSRVRHILIPYSCKAEITDEETKKGYEDMSLSDKSNAKKTAYEALSDDEKEKVKKESKKTAEEALKKAKDGEDFDELIKEYGWDPGMEVNTDGYFVNENTSFVQEFKDACFDLDEGEISDLVESESFGWFIVKRLPIEKDYVEENYSKLVKEYDEPRFNEITKETAEKIEITETDYFKKITKFSDVT